MVLAAGGVLSACAGQSDTPGDGGPSSTATNAPVIEDAGPIHVHALGVNPPDRAVFLATHTGLFRVAGPGGRPTRVAHRWQDTMGLTVVGPDHFLASGHPDGREDLPPFLGLIESNDAGRTWREVSLQGAMDFHVLEVSGERIYGFGADWKTREERLLVSDDYGRTWQRRPVPEPLIDLAGLPGDPDTAVAAGPSGVYVTQDAGRAWRTLPGGPALLTWRGRTLLAVDTRGTVRSSAASELGAWRVDGRVGGEPAAVTTDRRGDLYVALHDGTVKRSRDGGVSWAPWRTPAAAHGPQGGQLGEPGSDERPNRSHKALRDVPGDVPGQ